VYHRLFHYQFCSSRDITAAICQAFWGRLPSCVEVESDPRAGWGQGRRRLFPVFGLCHQNQSQGSSPPRRQFSLRDLRAVVV
jgi:hypothetical protein